MLTFANATCEVQLRRLPCSETTLGTGTGHEVIPGPYGVSPTPPGWDINPCHCQEVCRVSQHRLSGVDELQGDRQLLQESWTRPSTGLNP